MTSDQILGLLPLIVLAGTAVVIMLALAIVRRHALTLWLTLGGLAAAFACLLWRHAASGGGANALPLLTIDGPARFFVGLIILQTAAVAMLSYGYLARRGGVNEEYYILLLLACLGAAVLACSTHFATLFLGLETLSVSLYALIGYHRTEERSVEAAFKYLVLAAAAAGVLLFGMALVYSQTGTMNLRDLLAATGKTAPQHAILLSGMLMIVAGIAFKLALAPLHLWTPDVYEGAPAPVTAFIATVSKGGVFALLLRLAGAIHLQEGPWEVMVFVLCLASGVSMFVGNLLALLQQNVKRMLAYSSIAHMGYLLVAFLAAGERGPDAAAFYLAAYFVTTAGAFGVMSVLSGERLAGTSHRDADSIDDYRGLAWRRPVLAAVMAVCLLSLAGIPLTAGFVGKFYVVLAGVGSDSRMLWTLVILLAVNSAIGLYYCLRVIATMYMRLPEEQAAEGGAVEPAIAPATSWPRAVGAIPAGLALGATCVALVWLGVYPSWLVELIQRLLGRQ